MVTNCIPIPGSTPVTVPNACQQGQTQPFPYSAVSDLSLYREDGSIEWYAEEVARVGENRLRAMYCYLYRLAASLHIGECIDILKICSDEQNHRIAVKVCCEIINTYRLGWLNRTKRLQEQKKKPTVADEVQATGLQFEFNETFTRMKRIH